MDDQGRDVLKAAQIIKEKNLPFIGPLASMGNVYLGPLYYWAITPVLWLFGFNPVGPVVLVALLGVLTNSLLFFFLWRYFDKKSAFLARFLYALNNRLACRTCQALTYESSQCKNKFNSLATIFTEAGMNPRMAKSIFRPRKILH